MSGLSRRRFLQTAGAASVAGLAAGPATRAAPRASPSGAPEAPLNFQLGIVTYNIAKDWDLPTLLKVCKDAKIAAVEFRTSHKHGVEPTLTPDQRQDVKQRCRD